MIIPVEVQDLYASVQYVRRQLGSQNEVSLKCCCCKMCHPPCKGIRISAFLIFSFRIQNPGKFFLWNPESHYRLESRKLVPPKKTCTVHGAGTHGVGSRIQQCLGFHYVGQRHRTGSPNTKKKLCKEEIEETKQTYLTNNPLNSPWFLNLNPFLIRKHHSRCSCWSTVEQINNYIN